MRRIPLELELGVSFGLSRRGLPSATSFRRWVSATLTGRIKHADLALRVVDSEEGLALNRHFRGKDYPTNVLSFPAELPEGVNLPILGDIVLCAPVVAREASEQGKVLHHHYAHLTIHGVLHLMGFEHEDAREAEVMEQLERDILASLGINDPYRD
jgi:probable rRNA maturation factor